MELADDRAGGGRPARAAAASSRAASRSTRRKAVADDPSLGDGAPDRTLGHLIDLVDKSLLESESAPTGEARFRLLAPIRAHLRDRLEVAGEDAAADERRRDYFLALGEARMRQGELTALEPDLANLQSALDCAAEQEDDAVAVRLAAVLAAFWRQRGPWDVDLPWRPPAIVSGRPDPRSAARSGSRSRRCSPTRPGCAANGIWPSGCWSAAWPTPGRLATGSAWPTPSSAWRGSRVGPGDPVWSRRLLGAAGMHYHLVGDRRGEGLVLAELAGQALEHGDSAAPALYAEALVLVEGSGPRSRILEGAAAAAASAGGYTLAARLLGAAAPRGRRPSDRPSDQSELVDALQARIRSELGGEAYGAAVDSGRRSTVDELIDLLRGLERAAPAAEIEAAPNRSAPPRWSPASRPSSRMAASGLATKQIARRLGLGERTVKVAVARRARSWARATAPTRSSRATELGLLALPPAN